MYTLVLILISVVIVSLISFIGVIFIGLNEGLLKRLTMVLVGFASGTLLGGAFFHLLPESINPDGELTLTFGCVIFGIIVFFAMEKFLYWRHCHEKECSTHMFAYLNLLGDGIHNFVDGMVIAATFMVSQDLGFVTTLAVIFHEIPQEIGDFGVLVYGGIGKNKALFYNFVSQATAIIGALLTYFSLILLFFSICVILFTLILNILF
ncbi:MAG: ZIP family metal transporter [Candidatus Bathyarchaeia archaeon]